MVNYFTLAIIFSSLDLRTLVARALLTEPETSSLRKSTLIYEFGS